LSVGHSSSLFWEASALITEHVAWCGGEEGFLLGFLMFDTLLVKLNILVEPRVRYDVESGTTSKSS